MNSNTTIWVDPKMQQIAWKLINKRQNDLVRMCLGGFVGSKKKISKHRYKEDRNHFVRVVVVLGLIR